MSFIRFLKPLVKTVALSAVLAATAAVPALALDAAALAAGTLAAPDTAEEAEVCAAVSSFGAYALLQGDQATLTAEEKEYQELIVEVAYAWVGLAAEKVGQSDEAYMDGALFPNMEKVAELDNDTYMKHFGNCFERLVTLAEAAAASAPSPETGTVN